MDGLKFEVTVTNVPNSEALRVQVETIHQSGSENLHHPSFLGTYTVKTPAALGLFVASLLTDALTEGIGRRNEI